MPPEETLTSPGNALGNVRRARCAPTPLPDRPPKGERKSYPLSENPWCKDEITYRISGAPDGLAESDVHKAIHTAFGWWEDAMPTLKFTCVDDMHTPVDIEIGFFKDEVHAPDDSYLFRERERDMSKILAHSFIPIPDNGELGGDIHFSKYPTWKIQTNSDFDAEKYYDLITVTAHEIGHALGLDHLDDPSSLMYQDYQSVHYKVDQLSQQTLSELHAGNISITFDYLLIPEGGGSPTKRIFGNVFESIDLPVSES